MIISNACMCAKCGGIPTQEHFSIGVVISSLCMCAKCGGIPTQEHFSIGMIIPSPCMCTRYCVILTQNHFSISIIIYNTYMCMCQVPLVLDDGSPKVIFIFCLFQGRSLSFKTFFIWVLISIYQGKLLWWAWRGGGRGGQKMGRGFNVWQVTLIVKATGKNVVLDENWSVSSHVLSRPNSLVCHSWWGGFSHKWDVKIFYCQQKKVPTGIGMRIWQDGYEGVVGIGMRVWKGLVWECGRIGMKVWWGSVWGCVNFRCSLCSSPVCIVTNSRPPLGQNF